MFFKKIYLFYILQSILLNNIIKSTDNVKIEAKYIKIIDFLSLNKYVTNSITNIDIDKDTLNYDNILNNISGDIDSFKEGKIHSSLNEDQKKYKIICCTSDNNIIKQGSEIKKNELSVYIAPFDYIRNNTIKIYINGVPYTNNEIKNIINATNFESFLNKNNINKILNYEEIVNGKDESINTVLTNEDIDKYYISNLRINYKEELLTDKTIKPKQEEELIDSILKNIPIEVTLEKQRQAINLIYDENKLKDEIKSLLKYIKLGKTNVESNCKAIIDAIKSIQNEGEYKIVKAGEANDLSNDNTEIKDNTQYDLTLPDKCYNIEITFRFSIKNDTGNQYKFINLDKFTNKKDTIKITVDKNIDFNSLKKKLNTIFGLENTFEKGDITYKIVDTVIDPKTKFDNDCVINVEVSTNITDLVIDKDIVSINIEFVNNVENKEFKDTFTTNYPCKQIKNKFSDLLAEIKNILNNIQDNSYFEIYRNNTKLTDSDILKDSDKIVVKIVKDITEVLKDKQKDVINEEDKTDDEEDSGDEGTKDDNKEGAGKKENKKRCSNCKK